MHIFKWVNYMVYGYLNKVVSKKKREEAELRKRSPKQDTHAYTDLL